ncbi:MAG: hypothetical protein PHO84_02500 [Dysgonamonadaceae bacterium]|nr:hypothetical protein [Dysgonamonadaceae bacterium]MDD3355669.1 hypothetical protein [Dysgonamonadaceae bacterium]MDD3728112.1 hypothetical protein [Dysgonamonadaceae bacterium]MDD4246004.1 hypothetical protein [Dysgonamonadaceae bacterium]MDD4605702.1 hypothetical protein [Dysgonamonadaceae bacterium]
MERSKEVVSDKWIKASVLAGLWAGIEIIAGSFLHNLRIPFSGTFLTLISIVLVIGFFQIWPKYGIVWRAGVITALMKSISPSAVILGPMIAIALEGFIMELAIRVAGRNITGYIGAGMLTMVGVLTHKVVRLFLLFGWDIFLIYEEMFIYATEKLGFIHVQPMRAVLSLFLVYAVLGALAAFVGYRLGQRAKNEQNKYTLSSEIHAKQWQQPSEDIEYSTRFLILLVVVLPLILFALSNVTLGVALILTLPWFIFIFWRYRFAMRQLKKWLFWMQLLVILVLAWFFSKTSGGGLEGRLIALSGGMIMVLRALVVVTGFAALSTELRAPLMQRLFFRSGFRQLYLSVNHAFGILPIVISSFTTPRQFIVNPARSIAISLRHVNSWHQHLLQSLDNKEFE